ncbi:MULTISPECIES: hypothetical protein [Priestia]|jgi:hypothetical protein|uniref:hypothetical protein n=1 Tax=Priestia TaxID=2800373 RepID=UPI00203A4AE2|nr:MULTISPECIES: hypothetical protein [Priestia]MCM3771363.1 hypothetical protein [Priestia aryabhattai]MDY0941690.1 hypothetical protein [Priestia megaterium]
MSISKFREAIVIEGDSVVNRMESLYQLVHECMGEKDLENRVLITLTQIAFCNYLLGIEVDENCRLASLIAIVNEHYNVNYKLNDLHIRF